MFIFKLLKSVKLKSKFWQAVLKFRTAGKQRASEVKRGHMVTFNVTGKYKEKLWGENVKMCLLLWLPETLQAQTQNFSFL